MENQFLARQKEILEKHFNEELEIFKELSKVHIKTRKAFLECSAGETCEKMTSYEIAEKRALEQGKRIEEIVNIARMLKIITEQRARVLFQMINDIYNGG